MTEITEMTRLLWVEGDPMTVGDLKEFVYKLGDIEDELTVSISPDANAFTIEGDKGD